DLDANRELGRLTHPSSTLGFARGFAFSQDGRTLVAGREDGSLEIWDLATMQLKKSLRGHGDGYESYGIQLAPDGRTLASTGMYIAPRAVVGGIWHNLQSSMRGSTWRPDTEVIVVDLETGHRPARARSAMQPSYSPDGSTIATRQTNATISLRRNPGP